MKLRVEQSWWSCDGLPFAEEERIDRIAAAGFDGVHRRTPDADWVARCRAAGLDWSATAIVGTAAAIGDEAARAADLGARWMNLQIREDEPAETLLDAMEDAAERTRLALRVETHRGRITQDLARTCGFLRARPSLRLTLDLSHYVVAGELRGEAPGFEPLWAAVGALHLRVSNGEQVQVPLRGNERDVERFNRWWQRAIAAAAERGEAEFPAVCELGPPPYAVRGPDGGELSDRWAESRQLMALVRAG